MVSEDVLVYPTSHELASEDWTGTATCGISANTGFPSVQVPVGFSESGLPIGVTVAAKPGKDAQALAVAREIEAAVSKS